MSWDVILVKTKNNCEPMKEIDREIMIPFVRSTVVSALKRRFSGLICESEAWSYYRSNSFDVAFNLTSEEHIMLHIQVLDETEDAIMKLISDLCKMFGCRAFDTSTGTFLTNSDS